MAVQVLLSCVGLLFVSRTLSLLENFGVIDDLHSRKLQFVLSLPLLISLLFKEHSYVNTIYIGIFSIILILSPQIIRILRQKTFENLHLSLLQQIYLLILSGHSPQTAVQSTLKQLNSFELSSVKELEVLFLHESGESAHAQHFKVTFFAELKEILTSEARISEQLKRFRSYLIIKKNLVHRSRQIKTQAYVQAGFCVLLYLFISVTSHLYLELRFGEFAQICSFALFAAGLVLIAQIGRSHRWKT